MPVFTPASQFQTLIEELPVTSANRVSHGWAYVPDTGPIAAIQPGTRKRGAAREGARGRAGDITAKQAKLIEQRLAGLDRENYKDVAVPLPQKAKEKERSKKMTANVRRILTYQRTFAHYLDEEEAIAKASSGVSTTVTPLRREDSRRKDTGAASGGSSRTSAQQWSMHPPPVPVKEESSSTSANMPPPSIRQSQERTAPDPAELDPLLRTLDIPKMPTARVMDALLAEPPLSYNAARVRPLEDAQARPPRYFCSICGYWGKVRCKGCGERVCGRDCLATHGESCLSLV